MVQVLVVRLLQQWLCAGVVFCCSLQLLLLLLLLLLEIELVEALQSSPVVCSAAKVVVDGQEPVLFKEFRWQLPVCSNSRIAAVEDGMSQQAAEAIIQVKLVSKQDHSVAHVGCWNQVNTGIMRYCQLRESN